MQFGDVINKHLSQGGPDAVFEWIAGELTKLTLRDGDTVRFYHRADFTEYLELLVRTRQYKLIFLLLDSGIPSSVVAKEICHYGHLMVPENKPLLQRLYPELQGLLIDRHSSRKLAMMTLEGDALIEFLVANINTLSSKEVISFGLDWRKYIRQDVLIAEFPSYAKQKYADEEIFRWIAKNYRYDLIPVYPEYREGIKACLDSMEWSIDSNQLEGYAKTYKALPPFLECPTDKYFCITSYNYSRESVQLLLQNAALLGRVRSHIKVDWSRFLDSTGKIANLLEHNLWPHSNRTEWNGKTVAEHWQNILCNWKHIKAAATRDILPEVLLSFQAYYSGLGADSPRPFEALQVKKNFHEEFFSGNIDAEIMAWFVTTFPVTVQQYYSSVVCGEECFQCVHVVFKPSLKQMNIALKMALEKKESLVAAYLITQGAQLSDKHIAGIVSSGNKELLDAYLGTNPPVSAEIVEAAIMNYVTAAYTKGTPVAYNKLHSYRAWPEAAEKRMEAIRQLFV